MSNTSYDSLFTDRLFFGQQDNTGVNPNALNLSDPNTLTSKLWTTINIPTNTTLPNNPSTKSAFFSVKNFSPAESDVITDAIIDNGRTKKFFFDNNGNIQILDSTGNSLLNSTGYNYFKNPISSNPLDPINKQSIFVNKDTSKPKVFYRNDLIISNNKQWVLYKDGSIFRLLYNPLHRQSFKDYYNNLPDKGTDGLTSSLKNLVNQYCEVLAKPGDISPVRKYIDNSCNCLRYNDCIDDVTNSYIQTSDYRNKLGQNCVCSAPSCGNNLSVDPSSFMYDKYVQNVTSKLSGGECPDIKNIICSINVSGGSDVALTNAKFDQQCGEDQGPTTSGPITTRPPITTSPPITTKPPTTTPMPVNKLSTGAIIGIIFGVIAVIVILCLIIFRKKIFKYK